MASSTTVSEAQRAIIEIGDYSPLRHIGRGTRTIVSVGSAELPELVRHSTEYAEACRAKGEAREKPDN